MADKIFASGLIFKAPREGAPEFVKGSIAINVNEFIPFLEANANADGWVNLDVKLSQRGKLYVEKNNYQRPVAETRRAPSGRIDYPSADISPEDIPF